MVALIGLIGFVLVPASIIYFLIGLFKKDSGKKQKALKMLALGVVMFMVGYVFHESKPETADKTVAGTKQEMKQEEKQQPKQQQKPEIKEEPKPEVKPEVKQKKKSGFFSSLFGGSSREATPITDELLQKYIFWAQKHRLQKEELKDALVQLDKIVDLNRLEIDEMDYGNWSRFYMKSLPGESAYKYPLLVLARRNNSGKFVLENVHIETNEGYFYLYDTIGRDMKEPPIDVEKLFVTEEDRKAFRKVIENSSADFKELKFERDCYTPSWLIKLGDDKNLGNNLGDKFYSYVPLIGYAAIYSKEAKYYGGSEKQYLALVQWFKASDRSRHDKVLYFENIRPDENRFTNPLVMQWKGFNHLAPSMIPFKF